MHIAKKSGLGDLFAAVVGIRASAMNGYYHPKAGIKRQVSAHKANPKDINDIEAAEQMIRSDGLLHSVIASTSTLSPKSHAL